jgi:urea transport system permease protein
MSTTDLESALSNSISLSSIFILTALGLAITFGVMRVINMAHGDMLMLGAYTAYLVTDPAKLPKLLNTMLGLDPWDPQQRIELSVYHAIPICFLVLAAIGYLMEVGLIRFLYGRPLDTLLATWGVGLVVQNTVLLILGTDRQAMELPPSLVGFIPVGGVNIPKYRIFIVGITLVCLLAVYLWFFWTSFGLKIRAVVQNRSMASALGISTRRVDALTFAFATGLAGVAGCIMAYLYKVGYNMGNDYIVEAFMVVILGGTGKLAGSVAAAILLGTSISFTTKILRSPSLQEFAASIGISHEHWDRLIVMSVESMGRVVVLALVIVVILIRPSGLFVTRERTYD